LRKETEYCGNYWKWW